MERLSIRINKLLSQIDAKHRTTFKSMVDCDMRPTVIAKLKEGYSCSEQEANQIIQFICNGTDDKVEKPEKTKYFELVKKQNKILNVQHKLKNLNRFKQRENLGPIGQLNVDIGNEINQLDLDNLDEMTINHLVGEIITCITDIDDIKEKLNEDSDLLHLDVSSFCKNIDEENNKKKENISSEINNGKKTNKKKKQISNNKSHLIVTKYSQLIECEKKQYKISQDLDEYANKIKDIATNLGIFVDGDKCPQEHRWKNVTNNENVVAFKGQKAHNRMKNVLREIKQLKKECNENIETLKLLTNEVCWKKHGRLKSKHTLRERIKKYDEEKNKRNEKNAKKRKIGQQQNQNDHIALPATKKQKTLFGFIRRG